MFEQAALIGAEKVQLHAGALQWAAQWPCNDTAIKQAVVGHITGLGHVNEGSLQLKDGKV